MNRFTGMINNASAPIIITAVVVAVQPISHSDLRILGLGLTAESTVDG
jgi:hypothetical protein